MQAILAIPPRIESCGVALETANLHARLPVTCGIDYAPGLIVWWLRVLESKVVDGWFREWYTQESICHMVSKTFKCDTINSRCTHSRESRIIRINLPDEGR